MTSFEVKNNITLMLTVCFASLEAIGELQREKLRQSHAAVFRWNERIISTSEELSAFVTLLSSSAQSGSVVGIFHMEEAGMPCGGQCNRADFVKISKFPEILGELSMRKQCVPGSFFSVHAHEPGNKVNAWPDS